MGLRQIWRRAGWMARWAVLTWCFRGSTESIREWFTLGKNLGNIMSCDYVKFHSHRCPVNRYIPYPLFTSRTNVTRPVLHHIRIHYRNHNEKIAIAWLRTNLLGV